MAAIKNTPGPWQVVGDAAAGGEEDACFWIWQRREDGALRGLPSKGPKGAANRRLIQEAPFMRDVVEDMANRPCETKGLEDMEAGCCAPCRAREILERVKGSVS